MAEEEKTADTDLDFFQTLKQQNESLVKVLSQMGSNEPITYVQPAPPAPARPNYILYAAIGIAALIIFKKVKL